MVTYFARLFHAATVLFLMVSFGSSAHARPSDCLFEVDGQKIMNGPCQFVSRPGGSFRIFTLRGSGLEYVAEVNRIGSAQAVGSWNGQQGEPIPGSSLGVLMPSGACWTNTRVRVCAWRLGEPRYFVEAPPAPSPVSPPPLPAANTPVPTADPNEIRRASECAFKR